MAVTIAVASAGMGRAERIAAPQRIVSAFLCTDEYVFRLIPRERIAGLSYLAGDTHPVVSTIAKQVNGIPGVRASAEQMLALHPDLVVTYQSTNARQTQLLRAAGVRVLEVPWAQSLADVRRVTLMLGGALDASGRAQALVQQMDADLVRARAQASRPAVQTLIYEPNGYTTAGGVTDEILSAAGLKNAGSFARITRSGTIPIEAVLTLAPELLVLNGEHEDEPARADAVLHHPALKALNRHTVVVRTSLVPLLCPGPWSVRVAPQLAKWGRSVHMLAGHSRKP
ncbi:MAG: ABC transporter substrate-binding protein [Alphaproteobacteria bacterium]|nr:ABC transporter substrate-binding protein [Alphaproteobacteria bacterium]